MSIPYTLQEQSIRERLERSGGVSTLNALADRGIYLNNWQVNELLLDGNRGYGKSHLGYVKIALKYLHSGFVIQIGDDLTAYDEDATTYARKRTFISELYVFLAEHYADVFLLKRVDSNTLKATLRTPGEDTKRWWNR